MFAAKLFTVPVGRELSCDTFQRRRKRGFIPVRETTMQIFEVLLDDQVPLLLNSLGECYLAVVEKEVGGGKKLKGFKGR